MVVMCQEDLNLHTDLLECLQHQQDQHNLMVNDHIRRISTKVNIKVLRVGTLHNLVMDHLVKVMDPLILLNSHKVILQTQTMVLL